MGVARNLVARRKDGACVPVEIGMSPLRTDGELLIMAIVHDLTERRRAAALAEMFRVMVATVEDHAIFMLDIEGRVVTWNLGAERMLGYRADEIIGTHFSVFFVDDLGKAGKPAAELMKAAEASPKSLALAGLRVRKDGSTFSADGSITMLHDAAGTCIGFVKLIHDVTERRQAEEFKDALLKRETAAHERADRATQMRDKFLAMVSHDLRNPLAAVVFDAGTLLMTAPEGSTGEMVRIIAERISETSRHMSVLIEDLLDVASIDADRLKIEPTHLDAAVLVTDAVQAFGPLGVEKGLSVTGTSHTGTTAYCDRDRVRQVLGNLVGNAVKFTPRCGTVHIRVEAVGHEVRFSVSDTGPGMSGEEQEHVFDRFWQKERGEKASLGLGLYIAKGIVEAHGGRIWVESMAGAGSTFYFTLPSGSHTLPAAD